MCETRTEYNWISNDFYNKMLVWNLNRETDGISSYVSDLNKFNCYILMGEKMKGSYTEYVGIENDVLRNWLPSKVLNMIIPRQRKCRSRYQNFKTIYAFVWKTASLHELWCVRGFTFPHNKNQNQLLKTFNRLETEFRTFKNQYKWS